MPRKAVIDGGKRDEIIQVAMQLFFANGYESTSVRMILEKVGGEVGMFYHYFKSKDELFQKVVERFFKEYRIHFEELLKESNTPQIFFESFLTYYESSMQKFSAISDNMHWTIQYAMAARTIDEIKPTLADFLIHWGYKGTKPMDLVAGQLLYSISATLHSESFKIITDSEKKKMLLDLVDLFLSK